MPKGVHDTPASRAARRRNLEAANRARKEKATLAPHGTKSRYDHGPCRCPECRAAAAAYMRELRASKAAQAAAAAEDDGHRQVSIDGTEVPWRSAS